MLRPTTIALLLTVLWAVLHPSIINAAQASTHRVLVCTPNGMAWISAEQPDIQSFIALQEGVAEHDEVDGSLAWMPPCPFNHATQVLPLHDGMARGLDPLAQAYVLYQTPRLYTSHLAASDGVRLQPPSRAPPAAA